MEAVLVVGLIWLGVGILWSRLYYARRHGLGWGVDIPAAFIGMAWPVTVFTHRNADLCQHREHVLERARLLNQYENENAIINETLRREGR